MSDMYQLLDDLNLAKCRLEDCGEESVVSQLNRQAYERALEKVEETGRRYFGDDSLSSDDIKNMVLTQLADKAKTFLSQDVAQMIETIADLDELTGSALICMENVLNAKNDERSGFYYSNLFSVDREFLGKFGVAEIAKFEALSSTLVSNMSTQEDKTIGK
jgi:hypothetical protein